MKHFPLFLTLTLFFTFTVNALPPLEYKHTGKGTTSNSKLSSWGVYSGYTQPEYKGFKYLSQYISMRDSTLIAVDIFLPKKLEEGKQIPTIVYLTRYVRSIRAKFPLNLIKHPVLIVVPEKEIKFFTSHGYACIIVDVRGSGASLGERKMEFSPDEIADGKDVVDWIIKQPWSNGNVGTTGVSYVGTTAEMLLANKHPAVKACVPRSNIFDLYNYIMFPGGVRMGPFIDIWGLTTQSLDHNDFGVFGKRAKNLVIGINPVKGDKGRKIYKTALKNHWQNFDITKGIKKVDFRDDIHDGLGLNSEAFSVHNYRKDIEASGTPIYRIGGWYDGALAKSCLDGFVNTSNTTKVLVGPWDHGPQSNVSPFAPAKHIDFNVKLEILRFFDFHLKGIQNGINLEPPVRFYTVGEETWKSTTVWPPVNQERIKLFLNSDRTIGKTPSMDGVVKYNVDYTATTGKTTRWNSITQLFMNGPTNYDDRAEEDKKLLCFNSPPLEIGMEITGHPWVDLHWSTDANDATVFVYLEDVAPDGKVTYITEGLFRPVHRKVSDNVPYTCDVPKHSYLKSDATPYIAGETVRLYFEMIPISYQIKKGHSIRVSIAGADVGHFDTTDVKPSVFNINCGNTYPSAIELPVIRK